MKYIIIACLSCFLFSAAFTQANGPTVEEKRESQRHLGVRQGEEVEYCSTHWKRQEMMEKHPALKALYEKHQRSLDEEYREFIADRSSNPEAKAASFIRFL